MKLWYLTRTYLPETTGGALVRLAQIDAFKAAGLDVTVVTPDYSGTMTEVSDKVVRLPLKPGNMKLLQILERTGIYEDYLDPWVKASLAALTSRVSKDDLIFATSGGELGGIKLGSLLKAATGCRFVVNLHDPVDYTVVAGLKLDSRPHVSRERQEARYLGNADLVIASSEANHRSLAGKYPALAARIRTGYFGYIRKSEVASLRAGDGLSIVYGGTFDRNQSPELLAEAVKDLDGVTAHFVGRHAAYQPLDNARASQANCQFHDQMAYPDFLAFLLRTADLGFMSLASRYLGACVPSKLYEYINIGLPVLAGMPPGDGLDLVNQRGYGIACAYDDPAALRSAIIRLRDNKAELAGFRARLVEDRDQWHLPVRMAEVLQWLQAI